MSLKIRGFKARTADLREIHKVMLRTTTDFLKEAFLNAFRTWVETAPVVRLPMEFSPMTTFQLVEDFAEQNPWVIKEIEDRGLQLYPIGKYTYGWVYGSGFEAIETTLLEKGLIEDFSYWDNADKPEDITEREWSYRGVIWNGLNLDDPETMHLTAAALGRHGVDIIKCDFIEIIKKAYGDNEEWIQLFTENRSNEDVSSDEIIQSSDQDPEQEEFGKTKKSRKKKPDTPQYIRLRLIDPGNNKGKVRMYECPACRKRFSGEQALNVHTINECRFDGAELEIEFAGGTAFVKTRAEGKVVTFPEFTIIPTNQDYESAYINAVCWPLAEHAKQRNLKRRANVKKYLY